MSSSNTVIVGGGISGLSLAYYLSKQGIRSTIIEKEQRLGGLIWTEQINGCELEAGPDSYLASKPAVRELVSEHDDLQIKIIGSNDKLRRIFIAHDGKLVPLPKGMVMMVPGQWGPALRSDLFSTKTKLRFLSETLARPKTRNNDVSVQEFVHEHFGPEVLQYVAEPLLSGVYGGESSKLSAASVLPRLLSHERTYGSLIRGVRKERRADNQSVFQSFAHGMQTLVDGLRRAISSNVEIVTAEVTKVERSSQGWRVKSATSEIQAAHLVLACPTHVSSLLLEDSVPVLASELAKIPYSSCILVTLVFELAPIKPSLEGFGFLVPRGERRLISAATWIHSKFPSRVPDHLAAIRAFIVDPEATQVERIGPNELVGLVADDVRRIMNIDAEEQFSTVHSWPKSMPQYVIGHAARRAAIRQLAAECPHLHLVGNGYDGVGIPDCIVLAKETAKRICAATQDDG